MNIFCEISNKNLKRVTGISKTEITTGRFHIDESLYDEFKRKNSYMVNWLGLNLEEQEKYMNSDLSDIQEICFDVLSIEDKSVKIKLIIITGNVQESEKIRKNIQELCKKYGVKYSKIIRNKDKIPGQFTTRSFGGTEYTVLEEDFVFYLQCLSVVEGKKEAISLYPSQKNK